MLFVTVFAGCASTGKISEAPYITLSNINLLNVGVFEQRYRIMMRIQNPNDVVIPIKGMSYQIFINEQDFARGVSNKSAIIPEFGEEVVEIESPDLHLHDILQGQHARVGERKEASL